MLAALFEEGGETRVVLTRRAATLSSHQSEVAFPGGRVEPGEAFAAAALREAWEEVRLDPAWVRVVGELAPLSTHTLSSFVNPYVGELAGRPQLHPNPAEVELVFDVSLADLLVEGVYRAEDWGDDQELHFFELTGDIVWGATARLLVDVLTRVTGG